MDSVTEDRPLWKLLASSVNSDLNMVQYLPKKENPLDELLEMMLDSITKNSISSLNLQAQKDEALEENLKLKKELEKEVKEKETYFKLSTDYYKEKIDKEVENDELKERLKKLEAEVEELEERVDIEIEMNFKVLDKAEEWHERKNFEIAMRKDTIIFDQLQTIEKLRKDLDARDEKIAKLTKPKKFQQLRKLANKTKEKINTKVNVIKESIKEKEQKFQAHILQQFETHVLKQ